MNIRLVVAFVLVITAQLHAAEPLLHLDFATLWKNPITPANWPTERQRILAGVEKILGEMPREKVPLDPKVISEEDCGSYIRRKVSIRSNPTTACPRIC
jgi:hypothetical protein